VSVRQYSVQNDPIDPGVTNGRPLVCDQFGLRAIDVKSGTQLWRYATKGAAARRPLIAGKMAVFGPCSSAFGGLLLCEVASLCSTSRQREPVPT